MNKYETEKFVFSRRVLAITDGIDNAGAMRWELFGVLILSWVLVYFIIWKGINQSGYVCVFEISHTYIQKKSRIVHFTGDCISLL